MTQTENTQSFDSCRAFAIRLILYQMEKYIVGGYNKGILCAQARWCAGKARVAMSNLAWKDDERLWVLLKIRESGQFFAGWLRLLTRGGSTSVRKIFTWKLDDGWGRGQGSKEEGHA